MKHDGVTPWGKNPTDTIHMVLQYVDDIPMNQNRDIKLDCLCMFTLENQIDILLLTELKTVWDLLHYKGHLPQKLEDGAAHWSVSHNNRTNSYRDEFQPGGTATLVLNKLSHKMTLPGDNPSGLGRWN